MSPAHAKPRSRWPWVVAALALASAVAIGVVTTSTSAPEPVARPAIGPWPTMPMLPAMPTQPAEAVGPGRYEVGTKPGQIPPGHYRASGKKPGYVIVDERRIDVDGPTTVTVKSGQIFTTHGEAVWMFVGGTKS